MKEVRTFESKPHLSRLDEVVCGWTRWTPPEAPNQEGATIAATTPLCSASAHSLGGYYQGYPADMQGGSAVKASVLDSSVTMVWGLVDGQTAGGLCQHW